MAGLAAAGAMLAAVAGCGDPRPDPVPLQPQVYRSIERYTREYVLAPGDQVEVSVFHVPDASHTSTIRPDGFISLPILKEVRAGGVTIPDLTAELTRRYSERLVEPDVSVGVANPREASVYVVGEVIHPGPLPIRSTPTAAVAISSSGGVPHSADFDNVAVIRLNEDGHLVGYVIERANAGQASFYASLGTMLLQAGDIVVVPESGRSQFVRFIQDYINTPLTGFSAILSPYFQFKVIQQINH
jgi:polysaccharide export outer membrane protein